MIVYRCVNECELADLMGIKNEVIESRGNNTFKYEKGVEYRHFFYYFDSAVTFMELQNNQRYYNKYSVIMAYDIDQDILKKHMGISRYNMNFSSDSIPEDSLLKYFKTIYFPEFAIPKDIISKDMIVGIGNKVRITPISYISKDDMSQITTKNQADFLKYEKWLFHHGTNLKAKDILNNIDELFPIEDNKDIKKLVYK